MCSFIFLIRPMDLHALDTIKRIDKSILTHQCTIQSRHYNKALHLNIPYPVRSPAPQLPTPAGWRSKWAAVHLPSLSKTRPSFSACTPPRPPSVCSLPSPLGGLQTPSYPWGVGGGTRSSETLKWWCVLAHCPGVQRANMLPWSVCRVIDPQVRV